MGPVAKRFHHQRVKPEFRERLAGAGVVPGASGQAMPATSVRMAVASTGKRAGMGFSRQS